MVVAVLHLVPKDPSGRGPHPQSLPALLLPLVPPTQPLRLPEAMTRHTVRAFPFHRAQQHVYAFAISLLTRRGMPCVCRVAHQRCSYARHSSSWATRQGQALPLRRLCTVSYYCVSNIIHTFEDALVDVLSNLCPVS